MNRQFVAAMYLISLIGCDAISDAQTRNKALVCKTVQTETFAIIFNEDANGGIEVRHLDMNAQNYTAIVPTSRVINQMPTFQNWVTSFETTSGVKGTITDMPHDSCIDDSMGEPWPYRIDITNWGSVPIYQPLVSTGCCYEANAPL